MRAGEIDRETASHNHHDTGVTPFGDAPARVEEVDPETAPRHQSKPFDAAPARVESASEILGLSYLIFPFIHGGSGIYSKGKKKRDKAVFVSIL